MGEKLYSTFKTNFKKKYRIPNLLYSLALVHSNNLQALLSLHIPFLCCCFSFSSSSTSVYISFDFLRYKCSSNYAILRIFIFLFVLCSSEKVSVRPRANHARKRRCPILSNLTLSIKAQEIVKKAPGKGNSQVKFLQRLPLFQACGLLNLLRTQRSQTRVQISPG